MCRKYKHCFVYCRAPTKKHKCSPTVIIQSSFEDKPNHFTTGDKQANTWALHNTL